LGNIGQCFSRPNPHRVNTRKIDNPMGDASSAGAEADPPGPLMVLVMVDGKPAMVAADALAPLPLGQQKQQQPDNAKLFSRTLSHCMKPVFKEMTQELGGETPPVWKKVSDDVKVTVKEKVVRRLLATQLVSAHSSTRVCQPELSFHECAVSDVLLVAAVWDRGGHAEKFSQ
jgi:hypothetical protein